MAPSWNLFLGLCVYIVEGEEMQDQSQAWGWENLQPCHWQWEMGNEAVWEKHLATDRSCHAFCVKWKLLKSWKIRKQNLCTNRFKRSSKDLVLMCNSGQQRQEERAVTGSRCQNVRLGWELLCSALGWRGGRRGLVHKQVPSILWHGSEPQTAFCKASSLSVVLLYAGLQSFLQERNHSILSCSNH